MKKTCEVRPLYDRLVIRRLEAAATIGSLIVPERAKRRPAEGKVIAVGAGRRSEDGKILPLDIKVGDVVVFDENAGAEIEIDGDKHLILMEANVLAIRAKEKP